MLYKLVQLNHITQRGRRRIRFRLAIFIIFREKNNHFTTNWNTFHAFLEPFERTKLLKFKSYLKGLNLLSPHPPNLIRSQVQIQVKY